MTDGSGSGMSTGLMVLIAVALLGVAGAWLFGVVMKRQRERAFAEDPLLVHLGDDVATPVPLDRAPRAVPPEVQETLTRLDQALAEGQIDATQHALLREAALDGTTRDD